MMQPDYIKTLKQAAFEASLCHDNTQTWISILFSFVYFVPVHKPEFRCQLNGTLLLKYHGRDFFWGGICFKGQSLATKI